MHRNLLTIIFIFTCSVTYSQLFVDSSTPVESNNGRAWTSACMPLQDVFSIASVGDSIFVSKGTYYPDEGSGYMDNRKVHFFVIPGSVIILGGFVHSVEIPRCLVGIGRIIRLFDGTKFRRQCKLDDLKCGR